MDKKYRFSLRVKLVLFITMLAIVTYSTSAFFLYVMYDYVHGFWSISQQSFTIITLLLGIFWSGVLAYFAARFITKPLENLEQVASEAADGNLNHTIEIHHSDDEIRALGISFDKMLKSLRSMVHNIDMHFENTHQSVLDMKIASGQVAGHSTLISSSIEEISRGAESTSEAIQHTARAVEMATEIAEKVQAKARQSKEKSTTMLDTLGHSKNVVNKLVEGIQNIAIAQEMSLEDVEHLKKMHFRWSRSFPWLGKLPSKQIYLH